LHPAAEIKRVVLGKRGGVREVTGDGYGTEKRLEKNFEKKFGWNEKKPLPLQPERRVRESR
jgi:hypothetical protein